MVDLLRSNPGTHSLRQTQLRGRVNHPIVLSDKIARWFHPPRRPSRLLLNARDANGTLRCGEQRSLLRGSILTEGGAKSLIGHPDEPVPIGSQLRRLRMRFFAIEYLTHRLTFVGR